MRRNAACAFSLREGIVGPGSWGHNSTVLNPGSRSGSRKPQDAASAEYRWICRGAFSSQVSWITWRHVGDLSPVSESPSASPSRRSPAVQDTAQLLSRKEHLITVAQSQIDALQQHRCGPSCWWVVRPRYSGRDCACGHGTRLSLLGLVLSLVTVADARIACRNEYAIDVQGLSPFRYGSRPQLDKPCRRESPQSGSEWLPSSPERPQ